MFLTLLNQWLIIAKIEYEMYTSHTLSITMWRYRRWYEYAMIIIQCTGCAFHVDYDVIIESESWSTAKFHSFKLLVARFFFLLRSFFIFIKMQC